MVGFVVGEAPPIGLGAVVGWSDEVVAAEVLVEAEVFGDCADAVFESVDWARKAARML